MSELKNSTYWKKNGVVVEANSFVEDEQLRKDGWIKSDRGGYEWYKRSLAKQPPAAETGARGEVADVMCRCGYMASQHWADGSCPGDGYPYPDAPENHINDPELPYDTFMEILRKELHFPPDASLFGEWAVIEAIRQDRAIIMMDEGKIERLEAELAANREKLAAAQAALNMMNAILDTYTVSPIDEDKPPAYANDSIWFDGMLYGQWVLAKSLRQARATGGEVSE